MVSRPGFSRRGKIYLWSVIIAGFTVVASSIYRLHVEPTGNQWFILATLTLISGSATVRLPLSYASISISETFVFTAVLLYGPAAGTVIVALDGLVISFWLSKRHRELHRALFNMSAPAVSAWCSAHLFFAVAGIAPLVQQPSPINVILPPLVLFALVYFGLNSWLITFVIALEQHLQPLKVWKNSFAWLSLNYFGGASVAILLVGYNRTINLGYVGAIVPLLLVLYFTFKAAMGRVEDADKHVDALNRLYLSTIETLAMAIDAKDQVTHGHIRRVQSYAVGLAGKVGIRDESLVKAIEAAALLHDMGKLAVPEYILNKPGKLTGPEFEKMKLHASVGADILSAIEFPYPVVPIVRHHHENWDGTGYPTGLKGTAIPIGARILSVVDCFDALTSDRPYRPRLSEQEAIKILEQRRGTMYDPLIVDTFIKVHQTIAPSAPDSGSATDVVGELAGSRRGQGLHIESPVLENIAASAGEMLTLYELVRALGGEVTLTDAADAIAKHLKRLVPSSLCVFYVSDPATCELEAKHAVGEGASIVRGLRIELGQRLSGWVAANRQTISNSDPTLDLGDAARPHSLGLRSCISTPLVCDDEHLVGVLSLYSADANCFNDDHVRIIEVVGKEIARALRRTQASHENLPRDPVEMLPTLNQLEELAEAAGLERFVRSSMTLIFVKIVGIDMIARVHGRSAADEVLRHAVRQITTVLQVTDTLLRHDVGEFVCLINEAERTDGQSIAKRIHDSIGKTRVIVRNTTSLSVDVAVTIASTPEDGDSLSRLIAAARMRIAQSNPAHDRSTVH